MDLNKPHLIFLLTIINSGSPSPNKHLHKIYAILTQPQQISSGWSKYARWAEVLALTTYNHSSCITLACHTGTFLSPCLAHLCAICSKDSSLMRFTSFIPVFGILLAITDYTPVGHSLHQMNSHVASHLSSKHLTVPFQCGSMMENLIDETVHSWRAKAVF